METLSTFTGSRSAWDTFQFSNFSTFTQLLYQEVSCHFAALDIVGSNMGYYFTGVGRTVNGDYRDLGIVSCDNRVANSGGVNRVNDQNVNALFNQVGNVISLLSRVILCVNDLNVYALLSCFSLNAVCHLNKEWIVLCGNRKTNGNLLIRRCCILIRTTACNRQESCTDHTR